MAVIDTERHVGVGVPRRALWLDRQGEDGAGQGRIGMGWTEDWNGHGRVYDRLGQDSRARVVLLCYVLFRFVSVGARRSERASE